MPFRNFDFECKTCGETFEKTVETTNGNKFKKPHCPECKSADIQKLLTFGGYFISGVNTSSTRPRRSASFKRK